MIERLAFARALGSGLRMVVVDFPSYVHVIPRLEYDGGEIVFEATPYHALNTAPRYPTLDRARLGARALAKLYAKPQAIWRLIDDKFVTCAESIDVIDHYSGARLVEVVEVPC